MTRDDLDKLEILAAWHDERAAELETTKRRSPWTKEAARQLAAHHRDSAGFLHRLHEGLRYRVASAENTRERS